MPTNSISGEPLTQEDVKYQSEANTTPALHVAPEVGEYVRTQTLSVSVFNQVMASRGEELPERDSKADDALFGTHIKEAVRTIRSMIR